MNKSTYETNRLRALRRYRILDTSSEAAFDDLTSLAAHICGTPIALISLVDGQRIWFKSKVGWDGVETLRQYGFSDYAIQRPHEILVVPDASEDERFKANVLVTANPFVRFYAGTPLIAPNGYAIGTLCTLDRIPRTLSSGQIEALQVLGRQVITHLELRANVGRQERTIARQKRVERALNKHNARYRQIVEELQQTQTQLIQTEKMSGLGQMVAGVAHEINNPVSFVYGNITYVSRYMQDLFELLKLYQNHYPCPHDEIQRCAEAIDLNFLSEDLPKILASMKVGAERIRQIVLSLRNFSRLDEAEKKPVDIHQGIDNTLLILQHRLKVSNDGSGIEVIKSYGSVPPVECYAGQLNQVFMNILSNAIDALEQANTHAINAKQAIKPGHIYIHTEVKKRHVSGRVCPFVLIHIADNGPGIPAEVRERIFDPFFTTKPVGKGTGLGLSISYQIVVERHGGSLKFSSEPGQGTEFWIEIPIYSLCHITSPQDPEEFHPTGLAAISRSSEPLRERDLPGSSQKDNLVKPGKRMKD
jgi:two-component system, NtrC family, sensor kinase